MVKVAKVFFALTLFAFAYAADGLTLYTDPDFPDFSFEYDLSVWSLEQLPPNPNFPNLLKIITVSNANGEELRFSFEKLIETGWDNPLEPFSQGEYTLVGNIAVRVKRDFDKNYYYPRENFIVCFERPNECQNAAKSWGYAELPEGTRVAGVTIQVFDTVASEKFVNEHMSDEYIRYWQNRIWLMIEVSPVGLESYQADDIIKTLTY
jgi:hypothetical protein